MWPICSERNPSSHPPPALRGECLRTNTMAVVYVIRPGTCGAARWLTDAVVSESLRKASPRPAPVKGHQHAKLLLATATRLAIIPELDLED